jgi:hypothetical protein
VRILRLPINFVKISIGSKRFPLLAIAIMSVVAIPLAVSVFVAKRSSAHGANFATKKRQGCCGEEPAIPRRMIGTYYTTEDGFESTLILNNKGPNQIAVTPILHNQDGQTFAGSPVAVGGQSSSKVDINLLASIAGPQFRNGSFEFTYEGRLLEVGGGLRIINAEKSLIFDEQMLEPGLKFPSSRLEAVYALSFEDLQVRVIMTNTTAQPVTVNGDAIFAGADGHHPIKGWLGPYQTQVVNLPRGLAKKSSAGAVSLNHNGDKGALLAMIHLWDADRGYSESVNFINPGGRTAERQGAGLRLGSVDNDPLRAVIAVRNIGDSPTTVKATVPYSKQNGDTGEITLPQVSLAPGAIKLLDTSNPQLRRNDFATAGLEIKYTGAPGSVIASASSVSRSGNHVFGLPLKDPRGGLSSTGGYPWFIDEKGSTVVFIKNSTEAPQQFHLDIIFPGGLWGSNLKTLAPGQTFKLDVREVRDSQAKGSEGNTIPLDATRGHVYWSAFGTSEKVLIGRAQTVDLDHGMVSTYECQVCPCPSSFANARMTPSSVIGYPGYTELIHTEQQNRNCLGTLGSWFTPSGVNFSSANPSVATIDSGGFMTAIAYGSTTLYGSWTGTVHYSAGPSGCQTQYVNPSPGASCNVEPPVAISGPNNLWWFFNENPPNWPTSITLTADPPNASSYSWVISNGTAQVKFSNDSTSMTTSSNTVVLKTVNSSGTPNDIGIRVTVNGRQSPEFRLTSLTPHRLHFVGHSPGADATRGYLSVLTYEIIDQFGTRVGDTVAAALAFNEKWTSDVVNDYPGANWEFPPPGGTSGPPNFMRDFMAPPEPFPGRNPTPEPPGFPLLGSIRVQHRTQEWYVGSETSGKGRHVQINTILFFLDHGGHTDVQSPPPNQCGNPPCS